MKKKDENNIIIFRVILIGDKSVGKTSIIKRFVFNAFDENMIGTYGMDLTIYNITLKNKKTIQLQIVDTAGQERFRSLGKGYFKNADGVLFVFAHNSQDSFDNITSWIKIFEQSNTKRLNIPRYLIGNKNDLESEIDKANIDSFLKRNDNFTYKSTSAKNDSNEIKELFEEIAERLYEENKDNLNQKETSIVLRKGENEKKQNILVKCCL